MFVIELVIALVHFPPFLDSQLNDKLDTALILIVVCFLLKVISCLELMHHMSPLNSSKGRFVGSLSKTQITPSFLMKAWLKSYPLYALPLGIFSFLLCNSYVVYVVERGSHPTDCFQKERDQRHYTFLNCCWFSIISFLTVGYGDYYPTSIAGRVVNTIIIVGGLISSAIIIGLIHQQMQLSHDEYHVFKFVKTRRKEQIRKRTAAKLV